MSARYLTATILLTANLLLIPASHAASVNYCHDEQAQRDWEKLVRNDSEPEVKELYHLRKELCRKVDDGVINLDTAIEIFESERLNKIEAIKRRKMRLEEPVTSAG